MQGGQEENMGMSTMMREVQELAEKFKVEEDEQYISPYAHLEKAAVLQEARYDVYRGVTTTPSNGLMVVAV